MTDTLEATGKVTGFEMKSGGMRVFSVDTGGQWPLKVATKKEDIIAQGLEALEWDAATVRYTESDSKNINEHTGEPFKNRYVQSFLPQTPAEAKAAAEAAKQGGGFMRARPPEERLSIERQSALKTAFGFGAYKLAQCKTSEERAELELYLFGLATRLEAHVARPAEDTPVGTDDEPPPLTDADAPPIVDEDVPFV